MLRNARISKYNITKNGYFMVMKCGGTSVEGHIYHGGDAKVEREMLNTAKKLLEKAIKDGIDSLR